MSNAKRHRWGEPVRFTHKTERECLDCGLVKVTRHEPDARPQHWTEWWRDGERVDRDDGRTPACEQARAAA